MDRPGKAACPIGHRGFESLPFRQQILKAPHVGSLYFWAIAGKALYFRGSARDGNALIRTISSGRKCCSPNILFPRHPAHRAPAPEKIDSTAAVHGRRRRPKDKPAAAPQGGAPAPISTGRIASGALPAAGATAAQPESYFPSKARSTSSFRPRALSTLSSTV